jgi:hypothetical protein
MLYHRDHHIVISRGGVTEAVKNAPPPCRRYSQGHHVAKTLCTILRRGKREALFNVCRKYANSRLSRSEAYKLAQDPKPGDATVPVLPDDVLRMIWAKTWQQDAACIIQRAVRAAIAHADGDPWDLPPLVNS